MMGRGMRPSATAAVDLLTSLVAIDSVNPSLVPGADGEAEIAAFVTSWLRDAGLDVEMQEVAPGRPNVIGRVRGRGEGRTLALNAHMDTVGAGGMLRAHEPRLEGDRLYGRGAYDMKSGLAAIMLAASALVGENALGGDIVVMAVADEEYASLGTQWALHTVTAHGAVVTEPTGLRLCLAHKGFAWVAIETEGRAAHGSKPDQGIDAITHMGRVLVDIEDLGARMAATAGHPLLGAGSIHASSIEGGGELSSYPSRCRLQVERRTLPGEGRDAVAAEIDALLQRRIAEDGTFKASSDLFFWREPFEVPRDADVVRAVERAAADVCGNPPPIYGDTPWMDAALLSAAGIPTVVYGPGGAGAHADVEYASVEELQTCAEVLARAALSFCAPTGG